MSGDIALLGRGNTLEASTFKLGVDPGAKLEESDVGVFFHFRFFLKL